VVKRDEGKIVYSMQSKSLSYNVLGGGGSDSHTTPTQPLLHCVSPMHVDPTQYERGLCESCVGVVILSFLNVGSTTST
jgi:hypothetical protein